jgi:hypothetical protein
MLKLRMSGLFVGTVEFGLAPFFVLDRDRLRQGPDGREIARHVQQAWQIGDSHYSSIEIEGEPLFALFYDEQAPSATPRRAFGPFRAVRFADGHAYADDRRLLEFEETRKAWCSAPAGDCWPCIELRSDAGQ